MNSSPDALAHPLADLARLPMRSLAEAQLLVREFEALLSHRRLELRPPPPAPTTCCGRGCNGCVWQGYYQALGFWRDDALQLLR